MKVSKSPFSPTLGNMPFKRMLKGYNTCSVLTDKYYWIYLDKSLSLFCFCILILMGCMFMVCFIAEYQ